MGTGGFRRSWPLSVGGNRRWFEWNLNEAVGAIFSQLEMAVAFLVAWAFLNPRGLDIAEAAQLGLQTVQTLLQGPGDAGVPADVATAFLRLVLGVLAFFLVGRAPGMLAEVAGHRHVGVARAAQWMAGTQTGRWLGSTRVGGAVSAAGRHVPERAGYLYQPRRTFGRMMRRGYGSRALAEEHVQTVRTGEAARAFEREALRRDPWMRWMRNGMEST